MTGGEWMWAFFFLVIVAAILYGVWALFWFLWELLVSETTKVVDRTRRR